MLEFVESPEGDDVADRAIDSGRADVAALREQIRHLEFMLRSRTTIGQAIGLIMATYKLHSSAAFQILVRSSNEKDRKVSEIAALLVEQHNIHPGRDMRLGHRNRRGAKRGSSRSRQIQSD